MAVLKRTKVNVENHEPFDSSKVYKEIENWASGLGYLVKEGYPISPFDFDMLIIRSVEREVKITINSLNPYSRHEIQKLQQVFWVIIEEEGKTVKIEETDESRELRENNQTATLIVSNLDQLKRRMKEL